MMNSERERCMRVLVCVCVCFLCFVRVYRERSGS